MDPSFLTLVEIDFDGTIIRLVDNPTKIQHKGKEFLPCAFKIDVPKKVIGMVFEPHEPFQNAPALILPKSTVFPVPRFKSYKLFQAVATIIEKQDPETIQIGPLDVELRIEWR